MKISKDTVVGFVIAIVVGSVILWCWNVEKRLAEFQRAHNSVVAILNQLGIPQAAQKQMQQQQAPAAQQRPKQAIPPVPQAQKVEEKTENK